MKTGLFLGSFLTSAFVAAVPLDKRGIVWKTLTTEVVETVYSTTTVYINLATVDSSAVTTAGAFYEVPEEPESTPEYTPSPPTTTEAPVEPVYTPTPTPEPEPVYTPETQEVKPAPAPSTTVQQVAQAAYTPESTPTPTPTPSSSYGSPSKIYSGDITYYNPAGGYGSCGWTIADSDAVVAVAVSLMGSQSNNNPWCGKKIMIQRNGKEYPATVGDKCMGCEGEAIDLTQGLWDIVAPDVDGRGHDVKWYVVGE